VARVREQTWPNSTDPDALHDTLLLAGFLTWDELGAGAGFVTRLAAKRRAVRLEIPDGAVILYATERLPELAAVVPPPPPPPVAPWTRPSSPASHIEHPVSHGSGPRPARARP